MNNKQRKKSDFSNGSKIRPKFVDKKGTLLRANNGKEYC